MANGRPTVVGGLLEGLQTGLGIGQSRRQEALQADLLQRDQAQRQAETAQKQSMADLDTSMKLFKAAKEAGLSSRVLGNIWNSKVAPHLDDRGANLDFEGRGREISNVGVKLYDNFKSGKFDLDTFDTLLGSVDEDFGTPQAPAQPAPFLETQAREELPAPSVPPLELPAQPEVSPFAFEAATVEAKKPELFKKVDSTKFTPESIKAAEKSGSFGDLALNDRELENLAFNKDIVAAEGNLRKEFAGQSKTFMGTRDSFARIQESARNPSAAGDLAMVFNFMKMLDPASVVRESEFKTAAQARAWLTNAGESGFKIPAFIKQMIQKAETGQFLIPVQRADFLNRSKDLFKRQNAQHQQRVNTYTGIAKRANLNVQNIVMDLNDPIAAQIARLRELELKEKQGQER